MNEEKKTTEEKPEEKPEAKESSADGDSQDGDKPQSSRLIDDANLAAKRLEEANKKQEELLNRQEDLAARQALGGGSEAGQPPLKKEEISDEQLAQDYLEGNVKGEIVGSTPEEIAESMKE